MMLAQHEPSAHAACTRTMVEFMGKSLAFGACAEEPVVAPAKELLRPIPIAAATKPPRNLRRCMLLFSNFASLDFASSLRCSLVSWQRETLSSPRQSQRRGSRSRNAPYRGIEPSPLASPFEMPLLPRQ